MQTLISLLSGSRWTWKRLDGCSDAAKLSANVSPSTQGWRKYPGFKRQKMTRPQVRRRSEVDLTLFQSRQQRPRCVYEVQCGVYIKQHKPKLLRNVDWWESRAPAQPPNYPNQREIHQVHRRGTAKPGTAKSRASSSTLTPYFFSSALAHNLHPHQNLDLVVLKTHWLHVCLYASWNGHHR